MLAARRSGMKRVVLPSRNEPDLKDVPEEALRDLEIVFVERIDDLLPQTLTPAGEPVPEHPLPEAEPATAGTEMRAQKGDARV